LGNRRNYNQPNWNKHRKGLNNLCVRLRLATVPVEVA
jgi:hypothetical protein